MAYDEYFFGNRAVAFLDILGFQEKLSVFEKEAKENHVSDDEPENVSKKYMSESANALINTFFSALEKLDSEKYRYYLFSDNICITSISETNEQDLQDLLLAITDLYFEFARKGYFLRGGVDYGLFIDEERIAIGIPLAKAYLLESKVAIYPRIVLSENVISQFQSFSLSGEKEFDKGYLDSLVNESCEISYLNVFMQVFQSDYIDDKKGFFTDYKESIEINLAQNSSRERVYFKFKWLAEEFNRFIDLFTGTLAFLDENFDPLEEPQFLEYVQQQKIQYG